MERRGTEIVMTGMVVFDGSNSFSPAMKINDLHFHDMRHEAISRLFERAFSIEQVALVSRRSKRETPVLVTSKAPIRIGTASFWCGKCGLRTAFLQIVARIISSRCCVPSRRAGLAIKLRITCPLRPA
jgi:hypothetical protein